MQYMFQILLFEKQMKYFTNLHLKLRKKIGNYTINFENIIIY